jgi:hypothetical protein
MDVKEIGLESKYVDWINYILITFEKGDIKM